MKMKIQWPNKLLLDSIGGKSAVEVQGVLGS